MIGSLVDTLRHKEQSKQNKNDCYFKKMRKTVHKRN